MYLKQHFSTFGRTAVRLGLFTLGLFALAACKPKDAAPASDAAAAANAPHKVRVVTTFTILQDLAQNVAGDAAIVESITKPGAEIHDYEPTPQDIIKAQNADLVLWNGLGLELWFERFFVRVKDVPSVVLTEGVEPIAIAEGPYSGRPNPHAWMSPRAALRYIENVRRALVEIDPANAATYNANAAAYGAQFLTLETRLRERLARIPAGQRWLVTSEGAFSYLAHDFGLRELFLWAVNAEQQGTPQQVRKVIDSVRANAIPVIFSESTISDKPALQVARETGIRYGGTLYVDSLTEADGPAPTFLRLLEYNAEVILRGFDLHE